jgi:alpha-tubulin suppressor-like RCC1 family protein
MGDRDAPERRPHSAGRCRGLPAQAWIVALFLFAVSAAGCARTVHRPALLSFDPVQVPDVRGCAAIATGVAHACALLADGTVECWGNNAAGQLGTGTTDTYETPVPVQGLSDGFALAAGRVHTCVLRADGTVMCWGDNHEGQLGARDVSGSPLPMVVPGVRDAVAITAGWAHTCALIDDGTITCWGNNQEGQLGIGSRMVAESPVTVSRVETARTISAGLAHTCAVLADGAVACWGTDNFGQPVGKTTSLRSTRPVLIAGIASARALAAGRNHTCVLLEDGAVKCWGTNFLGQLGAPGGAVSPSSPVAVYGISGATTIAAGFFHTCAILRDHSVRCWGANIAGQLGTRTEHPNGSVVPVPVAGDPRAIAIAAAGVYTCALLEDRAVACWGGNDFNQLGGPLLDRTPSGGTAAEPERRRRRGAARAAALEAQPPAR